MYNKDLKDNNIDIGNDCVKVDNSVYCLKIIYSIFLLGLISELNLKVIKV